MSRNKKNIHEIVKVISLNNDDVFFSKADRILDSCTDIYTSDTSTISDLQSALDHMDFHLMLFERFLSLRTLIKDERERIKKYQPRLSTLQLGLQKRLENSRISISRSYHSSNFTFDTSHEDIYKLYYDLGLPVKKVSESNITAEDIGQDSIEDEDSYNVDPNVNLDSIRMRFPFKTSNRELHEFYQSVGIECELIYE